MGLDGRPQQGLQQSKTGTSITLSRPLQRHQRKHRKYRCMQNRSRGSTKAETMELGVESNCICQLIPERRRKKISID